MATSDPDPGDMLLILIPFNIPAPTPVAATFKPLAVPPVVIEEGVLTKTPFAVKVPAV